MNLIIVAALIAVCGAAKLDRTYLPPASAKTAGGSPGALQAPNAFSNNEAPKGSYTNDFQGVVVDAALAGTRASEGEASGLGGPRTSYGSMASKVGDAAFRGSQAGFRFPVTQNEVGSSSQFGGSRDTRPEANQFAASIGAPEGFQSFGAPKDSISGRVEAFGASESRPERPQAAQERAASTVRFESEVGPETFNYAFETDNGISAEESGVATNGVQAQGGYSYTGDDGKVYTVTYTADEGGYQPRGDHLPTPPPIPEEILKSLEQNARDEANGVIDDGLYDAQKYNDGGDYAESDSVNGKQNGRPSVNTGNSDVDASGTFINQNNVPFNPNNQRQRGNDGRAPVNQYQTGGNGNFQNKASGNRFESRNEYLPPFNNQNRPQNSRPQVPTSKVGTSDADSSSTFQHESTEQGSGDFQLNQQAPTSSGSLSSFVSRPTTQNGFNRQSGASNINQFNRNENRFPSSQSNKQPFGGAPVNGASHGGHSQFSSSPSLNSQQSTSIPDIELTTPLESSPHQEGAKPSDSTGATAFGFNAQSRPGQSQFGFQNAQREPSRAAVQPTKPSFAQSLSQNSNNRPVGGNRNIQPVFSSQAPQEQQQFNQQSQFGTKRPQFSQGQFSQNAVPSFAPSTQKPQFSQQATAEDDSYYYNQPSRTFNTPQTQGSRFPSAPSHQFDIVTQRPTQTTQYTEEENYPSTPFPSQNGQRQGSTRYPRPPSFPTESSPSNNQYQSNVIASAANGITQASASSFTAPSSSTGFNRQQFDQSKPQFQQPSFQSSRPSSPEPSKPFGTQKTAQPQSKQVQGQFEQQNYKTSQPLSEQPLQDVKQPQLGDVQSQTVSNQQYNGEIYEYTKPAETLPPPENGFGQFGTKVQSSKPAQRPQFSQTPTAEPKQPTPGQSFGQPAKAPQDNQFDSRPKFGQTSTQPGQQSFGSKPMRFGQPAKEPKFDQSGAQTFSQEQSTNARFDAKPSKQPFGQQVTKDAEGENQFEAQRRPFSSESQDNVGSTAESSFSGQNLHLPPCCKTFDPQQNFRQGSRPSQFGGESQFGTQNAFQATSGFKPEQSQSIAGKGEVFGGLRKPPSYDENGYHY